MTVLAADEFPVERKQLPPFAVFFLHGAMVWPGGVVGLAVASNLTRAGVPVHQTAAMISGMALGFTLEFVWAPLVDASLNRRRWFVIGAAAMATGLMAIFLVPWRAATIPVLTVLAFTACSGSAVAVVALKGLMAYDIPSERMPAASAAYAGGGVAGRAVAGALAIMLVTTLASRAQAGILVLLPMVLAASFVVLAAPRPAAPAQELLTKLRAAFDELWRLLTTPRGAVTALMCALPFGIGVEAGLMGAIAREWGVTPPQLALFATLGAATSVVGAIAGGAVAMRIGPFRTYLACGLTMMAAMTMFAFAPRISMVFFAVELAYRALATANYAALIAMIMAAVGKGSASTKAAIMWSLSNFAGFYGSLIEGNVHDIGGTRVMLLTDVAMGGLGLMLILTAIRLLRPGALK